MTGELPTTQSQQSVAVIITARNAAATIGKAVRSALEQPEVAEVAVIDDGSQDDTLGAARAMDDGSGRLKMRRLPISIGPGDARNIAIRTTTSPLICVLDADDYFLPGRIGKLIGYMDDCDFVADDLYRVTLGREDQPYGLLVGDQLSTPRIIEFEPFVSANLSRPGATRREMGFMKPLMRRAFLDRFGLGYEAGVRLGEDFILYATALAWGARFKITPPCGYISIEHEGSLSREHGPEDLSALLAASVRLGLHPRLTTADRKMLKGYERQVRQKLHFRRVLADKRTGGFRAAGPRLLSAPQHLPYIMRETAGARMRDLRALLAGLGFA